MYKLLRYRSYPLVGVLLAAAATIAGCSGNNDLGVLRTCGNGQVENGEECDDGGTCVGGFNAGGRCLIGEPQSCPGFTGECSLVPETPPTCDGGPFDGTVCTTDGDCCGADDAGCDVACHGRIPGTGGFCHGGPLDGAACGGDAQCCPSGTAGCGVRCIGECLGGVTDGADCSDDATCSVQPGSCTLVDTDSCTSICRLPICGDGVINPGLEQCENFDLGGASCSDSGRGPGTLRCTDACQLDPSGCGPDFTPTPTDTPLPTATETPTPTSTFPPGVTPPSATPSSTPTPSATTTPDNGPFCGNGLLEITENFIDPNPIIGPVGDPRGFVCEEDAVVQDCTPGTETFAVQVNLTALSPGATVTTISVFTGYRSDILSIPGNSIAASVRQRVRAEVPGSFNTNDRDFGLRNLLVGTEALNVGTFATITFDVCDGAVPQIEDVSCIVERCSGPGGETQGCACEIAELAG